MRTAWWRCVSEILNLAGMVLAHGAPLTQSLLSKPGPKSLSPPRSNQLRPRPPNFRSSFPAQLSRRGLLDAKPRSHQRSVEEDREFGHGKVGYVGLNVSVTPEQKDALIRLSSLKGTWLTEEVRLAIAKHLENSL
jgi:hypothetical protein